ncbi:hypothetical protein T484DRAFT_1933852 [Baffinella frigidus]|nr:hypothetical protein T484DRAFT_1933852 [Cryptophyta sp. CCMP2293]
MVPYICMPGMVPYICGCCICGCWDICVGAAGSASCIPRNPPRPLAPTTGSRAHAKTPPRPNCRKRPLGIRPPLRSG